MQPNEGRTALLLIGNIFLILTSYYLIKPVREGWLSVSVLVLTTPLISLAAYASMLATPLLAAIKAVKIAENSSN